MINFQIFQNLSLYHFLNICGPFLVRLMGLKKNAKKLRGHLIIKTKRSHLKKKSTSFVPKRLRTSLGAYFLLLFGAILSTQFLL